MKVIPRCAGFFSPLSHIKRQREATLSSPLLSVWVFAEFMRFSPRWRSQISSSVASQVIRPLHGSRIQPSAAAAEDLKWLIRALKNSADNWNQSLLWGWRPSLERQSTSWGRDAALRWDNTSTMPSNLWHFELKCWSTHYLEDLISYVHKKITI